MKIAPSLLACDFTDIAAEVQSVASADLLHLDVMDGVFVPNISFGLPVISSVRKKSDMVFDVHLMITRPERYLSDFAAAGADYITIHYESTDCPAECLKTIRGLGKKAGLSIRPDTPAEKIFDLLPLCDLVLVMTVQPGFGGQKLMEDCLEKIRIFSEKKKDGAFSYLIEADGGISAENLSYVASYGLEAAVMGSALFGFPAEDRSGMIETLRAVKE